MRTSSWLDVTGNLPLIIGGACLVAMMLQVTADVIGKFLFSAPVPVTTEMVTYYYMVGVALLPLYSLERGSSSLVHVELVYARMPSLIKRLVYLASLAAAAAYCFALAYSAYKPAMQAFATGTYAGSLYTVIIWPTRFFPIAGFGLLGLVLSAKFILVLAGRLTDQDTSPDSEEFLVDPATPTTQPGGVTK